MKIEVNGVRLFFDIEGASLVMDGATMRDRPTLVLPARSRRISSRSAVRAFIAAT